MRKKMTMMFTFNIYLPKVKCFLILFVLTFCFSSLRAQTICSQKLKLAEKNFEEGHIFDVSDILKDCLKSGFSKDEKTQALRLITLVYIYIDDYKGAENAYLNLLRHDPDHQVDLTLDPAELIFLHKKYRTFPIYSLGFRLGGNYSYPYVLRHNGIHDTSAGLRDKYLSRTGFSIGANLDYYLGRDFQIFLEANISQSNFTSKRQLIGDYSLETNEDQVWAGVPLGIKYFIKRRKVSPYFYAGASVSYLLSSQASLVRVNNDAETPEKTVEGPDISFKSLRSNFNVALVGGLGLKYKVGINHFFVDARYMKGVSNISNPGGRFSENELIFKYGYVDNDFTLDNMVISVGFLKAFYKPKKIK
jgi:hypothetical protein